MNDHNNDPLQFDDDLAKHLAHRRVAIADPGVSTIVQAGRRRVRRRRSAYVSLVAASVLGTGGVVVNRFRVDTPATVRTKSETVDTTGVRDDAGEVPATTIVEVPFSRPDGSPQFPELPASNIEWQRVDPTLAIGDDYGRAARNDDGMFLAVSTEPALRNPYGNDKRALYSSTDGISWKERPTPADLSLVDAMASDGSLYAVGTAPLAGAPDAPSGGLFFAQATADQNAPSAWKKSPLPYDLAPLVNKGAGVMVTGMSVARHAKTTVVAASVNVTMNLDNVKLPAAAQKYGFNIVGDVMQIFGPRSSAALVCEQNSRDQQARGGLDEGSFPTSFPTIPVPRVLDGPNGPAPTITNRYIIKSGDTIGGIAQAMGVSLQFLLDANGMTLTDANRIQPGMSLMIPDGGVMPAGGADPDGPAQPPVTAAKQNSGSTTTSTSASTTGGAATWPQPLPTVTAECMQLLNAPPPIDRTVRLVDLGFDPLVASQSGDHLHVFASTDGGAFTEVTMKNIPASQYTPFTRVLVDSDGFVIVRGRSGATDMATDFMRSADGRVWSEVTSVPLNVSAAGLVGGNVTVVGSAAGIPFSNSNDVTGWQILTYTADGLASRPTNQAVLGQLAFSPRVPLIGNAGFLLAVTPAGPGNVNTGDVAFDLDDLHFTVSTQTPNRGGYVATVTDRTTGAVLVDGQEVVNIDAPTVKIGTGASARTVSMDAIRAAYFAAQQTYFAKATQIVDSVDGIEWTRTKLSDLINIEAEKVTGVSNLVVDKDRFIVSVRLAPTDSKNPPKTVTFVGRRKPK
jgi:LysM repeat protein